MRRTASTAIALCMVASFAAACSSGDSAEPGGSGSGGGGGEKKAYTVAQIRWEAGDIFFNGVAAGETKAIADIKAKDGVDITLKTIAANDAGQQVNGIQQLITQGVDGVSLVPWRGESMVSVLKQLESQNIPVVVHNLVVPGQKAPFVAFDNVTAGKLAGEAIVKQLEESRGSDWASKGGTIMILRGDITASFDKDRFAGYMSVLKPLADANSNLKIVERADLGYQGEPARGAVADEITKSGAENILAVGSVDGTMAVGGAIPALKSGGAVIGTGQPNAVAVTSIDCSKAELDAITSKQLTHCSEQPALAEGELVQKLLYDMMSRKSTTPSADVEKVAAWDGKPWAPVELTTRDDIEGPWYKTQAFAVPGQLAPDSPDHWATASGAAGN